MEVLTMSKDRITVVLDDHEISYLAEACFELIKHPTSCGGTYMEDIGALKGEFEILCQVRELARKHEAEHGDGSEGVTEQSAQKDSLPPTAQASGFPLGGLL